MTPELKAFDEAAKQRFAAEFDAGIFNKTGGVYNCRKKKYSGGRTGPWSEHAWSAAKDYYVKDYDTPAGKAAGDLLAKFARDWGCEEVYWQIPLHYNHLHICPKRYNPDGKQVPPCAGGPPPDLTDDGNSEEDIVIEDETFIALGKVANFDGTYYTKNGDANGASVYDEADPEASRAHAFNVGIQALTRLNGGAPVEVTKTTIEVVTDVKGGGV